MNTLGDVITYIRRIIKTPSNAVIKDDLLIDYINRFWLMDVDARMQLFDLKTKYQFQTTPGIDKYNMPLYNDQVQPGGQTIVNFPVYQGFLPPAKVNGIDVNFHSDRNNFSMTWPDITQNYFQVATGDGSAGPYTFNLPFSSSQPAFPNNFPKSSSIVPGHVDITGIIKTGTNTDPIYGNELNLLVPSTSVYSAVYFTSTGANGQNIVVADSGQFLQTVSDGNLYGLLMVPGRAPFGNTALPNGGSLINTYTMQQNTINYYTGIATNVYFPTAIPAGYPINVQCCYYVLGRPLSILYYNNIITLRAVPDTQYLVELDAYLTPAAFLASGDALPFGYMAEYLARGAARKILADTGDVEQFQFYEPLFREQEILVWKRSQRQNTVNRVPTIYSHGVGYNHGYGNIYGNQGGY